MSVKTYDPACYELAEHFLKDQPISEHSTPYEQACHDLALTIQQAVEDWFFMDGMAEASTMPPAHPGDAA